MKTPIAPVKFVAAALATSAVLLILLAGFNFVVDPFAMFRAVDIPGFNRQKPEIYKRVRLLKSYEVRRVRAEAVILGSSRSHLGFSPAHPVWAKFAERRYNLAFDGATTKEMYYFLRHAHAVHPLKQAILCLDGYHPTRSPGATRPDFDAGFLLKDSGLLSRMKLHLIDVRTLTSFQTLSASVATLRAQNSSEPLWLAPDGQRLGEAFFRRPSENFTVFGPRYYFDEIDKLEVGFKLEWRIPQPEGKKAYHAPSVQADPVTSLDYIRKIMEFCRAHSIDLRILTTPAHAHQLELSAATGEWPAFEQGKRELARLIGEDARRNPGLAPIPLYDFNGYSSITTESVPPEGSRTEMKYYWDSSHFKQIAGDRALDRVLGSEADWKRVPDDFGVNVTEENIELVLQNERAKRDQYGKDHPEDVENIRRWVADYKQAHRIP